MNKLNVVVFDMYLICKGNLGSCNVVILKSVGFSTSRLHYSTYSFIRQWLWQVHLFSRSESSNVISVVSKAQWKSYILKCMKKPEK